MSWTIKGDPAVTVATVAGVTYGLNATERTLQELGISAATLKFQSLGDDSFTYTVRTRNAKGLGTIVPRDGQIIEVFHNGTRRFKGHVVRPKLDLKTLTVTVMGPWWWMGKILLSGDFVDGAGVTDDRTSYVFPTQQLRLTLRTLINRADDLGVPHARVNDANEAARIHGMYNMLKTTLSNMSLAAALAEIMSCVPDAVAWYDYSGSGPALNIHRRGDMTPVSYAVGGTGAVRVESAAIAPRLDQKVDRVELKYMRRQATNGYPRWANQGHGSGSPGKIQIVTISGPETLPFLPKDDFDKVNLKTTPAVLGLPSAVTLDPVLADAIKRYGSLKYLSASANITYPGWHRILSGETAEWMRKDYGLRTKQLRITGWVKATYNSGAGSGGYGPAGSFLKSIGRLLQSNTTGGTGTIEVFVDYTIPAINLAYPTKTTIYKAWDYDFLSPPASLAENLRDAQNWIPWEGPVTIARADPDGANALQNLYNLTNSHPDHADMDAMAKSVTYEIMRRRVILDLGAPARLDTGSLVNRLRRSPQDNIEWL
jgi:hypothetical protein